MHAGDRAGEGRWERCRELLSTVGVPGCPDLLGTSHGGQVTLSGC